MWIWGAHKYNHLTEQRQCSSNGQELNFNRWILYTQSRSTEQSPPQINNRNMNFWPGQENTSTLNIIAKHTHTHEVKYIKTAIHELSLWKAFKSFLYPACWILAQLTGRLHELVGWVCSLPHSTAEDCKSPRQVIGCCQFQNLPTSMAWMLLSSKSTHNSQFFLVARLIQR